MVSCGYPVFLFKEGVCIVLNLHLLSSDQDSLDLYFPLENTLQIGQDLTHCINTVIAQSNLHLDLHWSGHDQFKKAKYQDWSMNVRVGTLLEY